MINLQAGLVNLYNAIVVKGYNFTRNSEEQMMTYTERIQRERDFHDQRFQDDRQRRIKVSRYYETCRMIRQKYRAYLSEKLFPMCRVLEYGCGANSQACELTERKAIVTGIDLSSIALLLAKKHAIARRASNAYFLQMNAEQLAFEDSTFNVICGTGILHHLDLHQSLREIARVLEPEGTALFVEPLGNNYIINTYRRLTPDLRTEDEHPLRSDELDIFHSYFSEVSFEYYGLATIAAAPFVGTRLHEPVLRGLELIDSGLLRLSLLQSQAWQVLIKLQKPRC
jgi:ubiquinone/menaquinone biosynthesis C-methylase UbiE